MKAISVPVNSEAAERLDRGEERDGDLVELKISEGEFPLLFSSGWVQEVNDRLGTLVDDFEDEQIGELTQLRQLREITGKYADEHGGVFLQVAPLIDEALARGTGLYFHF